MYTDILVLLIYLLPGTKNKTVKKCFRVDCIIFISLLFLFKIWFKKKKVCVHMWTSVRLCARVHAWAHVSNKKRESESESRTSYKSLKNYSRIIAQLTFSFFPTRQRNPCPHFFFFCNKMNFYSSPLIFFYLPERSEQKRRVLDPSHNKDSYKCTKITRFYSSDVIFYPNISSLCLRWPYLWGWHSEGLVPGLEYRAWRGTIQG